MRITLLAAVSCAAVIACQGKSSDRNVAADPPTAPPASDASAATDSWYDETRELYFGIPVIVRFTPANPGTAKVTWSYLERIDDHFNSYKATTEVGKLNSRADQREPVPVSAAFADAFAVAKRAHRDTGGAFDITVAPLVQRWELAAREGKAPTDTELRAVLNDVGLDAASIKTRGEQRLLSVRGRRAFDFGGLIKGLAADRALGLLRQAGATSAFVSVGGETASFGVGRTGKPFVIAIEDPRNPGREYRRITAPIGGLSATTSANNRKPTVIEGTTYYHILDPRTGKPVPTNTLSATVVFTSRGKAWLADALATTIPIVGPKNGLELAQKLGAEALILVEKNGALEEHQTPGFKALVAN